MRWAVSLASGADALPAAIGWQQPAVTAAVTALVGAGRGQIHSACGTGKTITAAHIAARLCPPGGIVVIACPTVALLAQTLAVIGPSTTATLAVCGDDTVADTAVHTSDLPTTVTTDLDTIGSWLRQTAPGVRLIFTTHRSAGLLGQALISAGHVADILVVDEAHHSAGRGDKHLARLHTDRTFPAPGRDQSHLARLTARVRPRHGENPGASTGSSPPGCRPDSGERRSRSARQPGSWLPACHSPDPAVARIPSSRNTAVRTRRHPLPEHLPARCCLPRPCPFPMHHPA